MTESHNIGAIIQGKKKAFETVYYDFYDVLFHLAAGYTGEREVARELVQDAFMKLWENRKGINEDTNLKNYLYTITKNNCLNHIRHKKLTDRILLPELQYRQEAIEQLPDSFADVNDLMKRIEEAINQLPPGLAETFRMNRFQHLTYSKIAEIQNVSVKTIEARMSRALKILRTRLKDYMPVVEVLLGL